MPNLEASAWNQLLLHQLLAGLPSSISKQLHATGDTTNVDRVLERAVEAITPTQICTWNCKQAVNIA